MPGTGKEYPLTDVFIRLRDISRQLAVSADALGFSGRVAYVYNPMVYARRPYEEYLKRYATGRASVLFLGMNPGPWGMAQTGVPFGDVVMVRDWLGIEEAVERPYPVHPRHEVEGFSCKRREISGSRLWGWAMSRYGVPRDFFLDFFVLNYCPLMFLDRHGRNITPDRLVKNERMALGDLCGDALRGFVSVLKPKVVVGIGVYAHRMAMAALNGSLHVVRVSHPSPANPLANRGWARLLERQLAQQGVDIG